MDGQLVFICASFESCKHKQGKLLCVLIKVLGIKKAP